MHSKVISGIRPSFPGLSQSSGQITHVLLTRSPLEYPASWAFPFDLHVLSTPPAFVLSQDQTLHEKIAKQNQHPQGASVSTQSGKQNLTNPKLAKHVTPRQSRAPHKKTNIYIHKECTMPKMASDNSSSHYRVLKEHTPTSHSPPQGLSPADFVLTFHRHPVSGATLPAYQTQTPPAKSEDPRTRTVQQPHTPSPRHQVSNQKIRGGQRKTRSPLPTSQTLSGPPGRRRGSLTRHKLRTVYPQHKSAGQRLLCAVRSGRTVAVLPHVRLCGRRSVPGSRRRRHPLPNAGRTPPRGRTSWPALPG